MSQRCVSYEIASMASEHDRDASEDCTVIMESSPGVLRREHRSLQKQMCCAQFMTVFVCLTCCLLTLMYHANPSGCKEDDNLKPSASAMQMQKGTAESNSNEDEETSHEQKQTPFILVTTCQKNVSDKGYVTWKHPGEHINHTEFSLDSDGESLIIHRPGTYRVSLQILYRGVRGKNYDRTNLLHEIRRDTNGYPRPLKILVCMETINFSNYMWRKTLFSEGVYSLKTGDRLKVWSDDRSLIDGSGVPEKAFFLVHPHFFS